ncbi:ATP-binding protein [Ferrovum sp.]|uniref:ATP-binding protein n=1 Tax=Ferrovum sp. TaxID=2609467 RepID=UPI00345BD094
MWDWAKPTSPLPWDTPPACVGIPFFLPPPWTFINTLAAAQSSGRLKQELARYLKPAVLIIDELGYLPIDKQGADLLFQIISQRYERAPHRHHHQSYLQALVQYLQ